MKRMWSLIRHLVQIAVLSLFLSSLTGWHGVIGTLSASRVFGISLADPFAVLQIVFAQHRVTSTLGFAALWILLAYWILGGRTFCGWICPVNTLLEPIDYLRERFNLPDVNLGVRTKYWVLVIVLILSLILEIPAFEVISPIGILLRNLLYGFGLSIIFIVILIGFESTVSRRGFCRYLCPLGAFYGLIGRISPLQVRLQAKSCIHCGQCTAVCPMGEAPLQKALEEKSPRLDASECIKCAKCIEICPVKAIQPEIIGIQSQKPEQTIDLK